MTLESNDGDLSIHVVSGLPSFLAADRLEAAMLAEAGLAPGDRRLPDRGSPTAFHVALGPKGEALGVACTTIGPLPDLPLGLALARMGVPIDRHFPLPGPTCELVSLAVEPMADGSGIAEALYRSFYLRARRHPAQSLAVGVDPWVFDILREQYGVPFEVLGPPLDLLGRELLPVGGELGALEAGVAEKAPRFHAFLTGPLDAEQSAPR